MSQHLISIGRGLAARPALRLAVLLAAGIFTSRNMAVSVPLWYALFAGATLGALILRYSPSIPANSSFRLHHAPDILLHLGLIFLGASLYSFEESLDRVERLSAAGPDYSVMAYGWIVTSPNPTRNGHSFVLETDSIGMPDRVDRKRRRAVVYVRSNGAGIEARPGDRVAIRGTLERFPAPRNPGELDYGAALGLQGISAVIAATDISQDSAVGWGTFRSIVGYTQDQLYRWIDDLHPGEHGAFVKGIILGYRADLPEDLKGAFMITGTVHILAVSGSNVALIALIVMVCGGFVRFGRVLRVALTIAGMLVYMLITGGGPSITRATIMGIIVVMVVFLPRRGDVIQSLGMSACVLLLLDPRTLFDAGFLLSFGSVIWIVTGHPVLERVLNSLPEEFRESIVIRSTLQLCGVSLLAQLGTVPISALFFGQISLVSILANLIVVPLSALVLLLGVTELALHAILPPLAIPYTEANGIVIDVLLGFVRIAAKIPYASMDIRISGVAEAVVLYSVFVGIVWCLHADIRKLAGLMFLLALNVLVWSDACRTGKNDLTWIAVDVGQGDAHIIRTPGGRTIIIDAAPTERGAERTLLPLLGHLGIDGIDLLILTHPHHDHTAGVGVLLDHVPVRTLVITDSVWLREKVSDMVVLRGVRIVRASAGMSIPVDTGIRVYVLHPSVVDPSLGWNDNSIVMMVRYGDTKAIFTGDLEEEGEEALVDRYGQFLRSGLLKTGHHGSKTSTSQRLVSAVQPHDAVISVGWRNRFGHPSPETEAILRRNDIRVARTSEQGAVWWRSDGKEWREVRWRD